MNRILSLTMATAICLPAPLMAQEALDGWFIAMSQCEAYQSKNKLTNPGDVVLIDRVAYDMIGINKANGDWYQIKVPEAPVTSARWVSISCGVHVIAASPGQDKPVEADTPDFDLQSGAEATELLLALSWQPAFCETKPSKTECLQLNDGLLPVTETQLSLHGLWPQPRGNTYCGVPAAVEQLDKQNRWSELPAPALDADTAERLQVAMPGTASFLERHEWIKHGTCFFGDRGGDEFYDDTLQVLDAINASSVGMLFSNNVGAEITADQIRAAFDQDFGIGAGERVQVKCTGDQGRVLIQEITINISGEITPDSDIGALIRAAPTEGPGCPRGLVDPVGLQ